ncbi:hypothetical protein L917_20206 [Phytophthora nicotianae]|uniref:Uncharacterized protein n=1 Tax=Phytophthora nicotianae TaxID=4792 RepID=W2K1P2_PHYNI|nr:hypothetical protein L917_20206 [Phytophthora nicotianae]
MATSSVDSLLAVTLVFRSKPGLESLAHVVESVSTFLDSSVELPIKKACRFNSIRLLDRIWDSSLEVAASSDSSWSIRNLLHTETHYRGFQFTFSIMEAVKLRNVEMVHWLCDHLPGFMVTQQCLEEAASIGTLEILQYFLDNGFNLNSLESEDYFEDDTEEGKNFCVDWGYEDAAKAATAGHRDIVMWLYEQAGSDARNNEETLKATVASGEVDLLRWLLERISMTRCRGMHEAAANGHVNMLEFLIDEGFVQDDFVGLLLRASEAGQMRVVRWIIDRDWSIETSSDHENGESSPFGYNSDDERSSRRHSTSLGGEASLAIHSAAVNGHLEVAKYLHARVGGPLNAKDEEIEQVRQRQTIRAIKDLGLNFEPKMVSGRTMFLAAQKGLLEVVQWLYQTYSNDPTLNLFWSRNDDTYVNESAFDAAASNGHFEVLQFLHQAAKDFSEENLNKRRRLRKFPDPIYPSSPREMELHTEPSKPGYTTAAMDGAAANGHLHVLRWLFGNENKGCTTEAMSLAARNGHFEVVQWLYKNVKIKWTSSAMDGAASGGHMDILKWLHARGLGCTVSAMDGAARGGHFEVVKWLNDHRSEGCTTAAMDGAASSGALNLVKWLHEHRSEGCTSTAIYKAALHGHLDVIKWLHVHYSEEFPAFAMENAALSLSFETVLFLHRIKRGGCTKAVKIVEYLSLDMLGWIRENYRDALSDELDRLG